VTSARKLGSFALEPKQTIFSQPPMPVKYMDIWVRLHLLHWRDQSPTCATLYPRSKLMGAAFVAAADNGEVVSTAVFVKML
jgi:hypothetical protein